MRISDWSSDVCSSDLLEQKVDFAVQHIAFAHFGEAADIILERLQVGFGLAAQADHRKDGDAIAELRGIKVGVIGTDHARLLERAHAAEARSEEHTSELQSLMRISYAVFCLKKKKSTHQKTHIHTNNSTYQTSAT